MRSKEDLYVSLDDSRFIHSKGSGELFRGSVPLFVHAGPKSTEGREVNLILTSEECVTLASKLIGLLSFDQITRTNDSDEMKRLRKILAMTRKIDEQPK